MVPIAIRHPSEMSAETPQAHRLIRAMPSERSWSSTTAGTYPGKESAGGVLSGTQPKGRLRPPKPSLRLAPKKHFDAAQTSSPQSWR
jgi:hypothetical protein